MREEANDRPETSAAAAAAAAEASVVVVPTSPAAAEQAEASSEAANGHVQEHADLASTGNMHEALKALLQTELQPFNLTDFKPLGGSSLGLGSKGRAVFRANMRDRDGKVAIVAVRAYFGSSGCPDRAEAVRPFLKLNFLVQRSRTFRTENFWGVIMPRAHTSLDGLLGWAARDPRHHLSLATVLCCFQQIVLIIDYARRHGLVRDLDPTRLLLFYGQNDLNKRRLDTGRPMLKLDFTRAHARAREKVDVPYISPQSMRQQPGEECSTEHGTTDDMWAAAVLLYLLVYRRWPFAQAKRERWPSTPKAAWNDDNLEFPASSEVTPCMITWMKNVFNGGRLGPEFFHKQNGTLASLLDQPWFQKDLEANTRNMQGCPTCPRGPDCEGQCMLARASQRAAAGDLTRFLEKESGAVVSGRKRAWSSGDDAAALRPRTGLRTVAARSCDLLVAIAEWLRETYA
eukprot:jgi/Ulvmu1/8130/UM040_0026.1